MFIKDRLDLTTQRTYTDEGFLIVPAKISRIGIQNYYAVEMGLTDREATDVIKVYRPPEEVFKPESLESFQNKPVTDDHPAELVNASNSKELVVGHAANKVVEDGDFVATELFVTDIEAIKKIQSGKVELSNGYTADIEWTSGVTPRGEVYDAIQRNIKGNHIALVEKGRAGSSCRVADHSPIDEEFITMKIVIDGVDFDVSESAAIAVKKLQTRLSDAEEMTEKEIEAAKAAKEKLKETEDEMEEEKASSKKTEDSLRARLDDAKSKVVSGETLDKLVADRAAFIDGVKKIAPSIKWEGKDAMTIKKEVVALARPNVQLDSVSDDYVNASFDLIADGFNVNSQQSLDNAVSSQVIADSNSGDKDNRPAHIIARDNYAKTAREAWKTGVQK